MNYWRIHDKITRQGIPVRRGLRPYSGEFATDSGDLGRGEYFSTNYHIAKNYGTVTKSVLRLRNPLVLSDDEAYQLADLFQTVRLTDERIRVLFDTYGKGQLRMAMRYELLQNAQNFTNELLQRGYDGLVVVKRNCLEIVRYTNDRLPTASALAGGNPLS